MLNSTTTLIGNDAIYSIDFELILLRIYNFFTGFSQGDADAVFETIQTFWFYFQLISYSIVIILIGGVVYCIMGLIEIRKKEAEYYGAPKSSPAFINEKQENQKWKNIEELTRSENPNDWRLAILEADILLDELVSLMGYKGETFGEKLKTVEQSDFTTLEQAWEAHKIRNQIAHTGSDYILTLREARRVIDLYRQVFEEFHFI